MFIQKNKGLPSPQELEAFLSKNLLGQEKAAKVIVKQYGYFRSGFKELTDRDKKRPIGVFFFVGPSGVGKTEAGRLVAQLIHGSREAVTFVEMAGYKMEHNVATLIGAPPGYIGYKEPPVFSKEKMHSRIPALRKFQKSASEQESMSEIDGNEEPKVFTFSPLESLEFQERMQSIKLNQLDLITHEMEAADKSILVFEEEIAELERKLNGLPLSPEDAKIDRGLLKKILEKKLCLEQFRLRKKALSLDYLMLLQENWAALLVVNRQKKEVADNSANWKTPKSKAIKEKNETTRDAAEVSGDDPVLIIILDEIALAHPDIHDFFLHVFEEGEVALKNGEIVDFSKALIFMTANIAAEQISSILKKESRNIGFLNQRTTKDIDSIVKKELSKSFKPPFLNRIDEVVVFEDLSDEALLEILNLNLEEFKSGLKKLPLGLTLTDEAKKFILAKAKQKPEAQARNVLDEFKKLVKIPLEELFANGQIKFGQTIIVKVVEGKIKFFFVVDKK